MSESTQRISLKFSIVMYTRDKLWHTLEVAEMMMIIIIVIVVVVIIIIIMNLPDVFQRIRNSWNNRAQLCIDCNGGPF
jgi:hypothetical protein